MKVVAVIPVRGRLPLLRHTIRRLYQKNGVDKVICVGDSFDEQVCCTYEGAEFIKFPNDPLGRKWNKAFVAAKKYQPDAVLFVGSSDWVSDNWLSFIEPYMNDFDLVGKPDFNLLDIGDKYRFCQWKGYQEKARKEEPIGIGRVISARILDLMQWNPIRPDLNSSIDYSMYKNVLDKGGKVKLLKTDVIHSLSISTNRWTNMHKFEQHWTNKLPSDRRPDYLEWLEKRFPEYKEVFKDEN